MVSGRVLLQNPMYSFSVGNQSSEDLEDVIAMQSSSLNDLQQLTVSLQRETAAMKSVAAEQQEQIDVLTQQVCIQYYSCTM